MAQDFSLRYPLIDGHGNFGTPDPNDRAGGHEVLRSTATRGCGWPTGRPGGSTRSPTPTPNSDVDVDLKVLDRDGNPVRATKFFHSRRSPDAAAAHARGLRGHRHAQPPRALPRADRRRADAAVEAARGDRARHACRSCRVTSSPSSVMSTPARARRRVPRRRVGRRRVRPTDTRAGFNNTDRALLRRGGRRVRRGRRRHALRRAPSDCRRARRCTSSTCRTSTRWSSESARRAGRAKSADKCVPEFVWHGQADVKQAFLQALFEGDGCVSYLGKNTIQISYSTRSEQLARDVQDLLLEFGVVAVGARVRQRRDQARHRQPPRRRAVRPQRRVLGRQAGEARADPRRAPRRALEQRHRPHPVPRRVRAGRERRPRRRPEVAREAQLRPHPRLGAPRARDPRPHRRRSR